MKYGISMPMTGIVYKEIEAETEKEALEKFWGCTLTTDDIHEWDLHEHVTTGNVTHAMLNDYDVEELEEY